MPAQAQSTTEQEPKMVCKKCKTASLRRRTPNFINQFLSFYPYTCGRCGTHQKRFRLTFVTILPVLLLLGAISRRHCLGMGKSNPHF